MMSKTIRRIEITAFRRQRLATTGTASEPPAQPSMTDGDESLAAEIFALIKGLTGDFPGSALGEASQKQVNKDDGHEYEPR